MVGLSWALIGIVVVIAGFVVDFTYLKIIKSNAIIRIMATCERVRVADCAKRVEPLGFAVLNARYFVVSKSAFRYTLDATYVEHSRKYDNRISGGARIFDSKVLIGRQWIRTNAHASQKGHLISGGLAKILNIEDCCRDNGREKGVDHSFVGGVHYSDIGAQTSLFTIVRSHSLVISKSSGETCSDERKEKQYSYRPFQWVRIFFFGMIALTIGLGIWCAMFVAARRGFQWFCLGCFLATIGWFAIVFQDGFLYFAENISAALGIDAATCYREVAEFSQSSSTFTISDISQSLGVTPPAIAGVIFRV